MNANCPPLRCWVPRKFLTGDQGDEGAEEGYAFGIISLKAWALMWHVMLESGAHFRFLPLHAIWIQKPSQALIENAYSLDLLQLWDCFSSRPIVTVFDYLRGHQCLAVLKDRTKEDAEYLFTVDWLPDSLEMPGFSYDPSQNKCGHVLALENGQVACLPSNRVIWRDAYFIGNSPSPHKMGYKTCESKWSAEDCNRWSVAEDCSVFYGMNDEQARERT